MSSTTIGTEIPPLQAPPDFGPYADFGPSLASVDVDLAVIETLRTWLPTHLRHQQDRRDLGFALAVPRDANYANVLTDTEWPDVSLPAILVATSRVVGQPERSAEGAYIVTWLVAISAVIQGRTAPETRLVASLYELAVRQALVQHQSLLGLANGCRWIGGGDSRPLRDPTDQGRYLGEGASQFWVFTEGAVQEGVGPTVPADAYGPLPQVDAVEFDVVVGGEVPPGG